ncbi:MAG: hypothetical protein JW981_03755 [Anaerolineae bacterium]|nr:hypothetical protein [Anaerolineae bacterium]
MTTQLEKRLLDIARELEVIAEALQEEAVYLVASDNLVGAKIYIERAIECLREDAVRTKAFVICPRCEGHGMVNVQGKELLCEICGGQRWVTPDIARQWYRDSSGLQKS